MADYSKFEHLIGDPETPPPGRKMGRPSGYKGAATCEKAHNLALLGYTDVEIAAELGIHEGTLYVWKQNFPEFYEAVESGKVDADGKVALAAFKRASGFTRTIERLDKDGNVHELREEVPPDPVAAKFWLANRQRSKWREQQRVEHTGPDGKDLMPEPDTAEIARRLAFLMTQQARKD